MLEFNKPEFGEHVFHGNTDQVEGIHHLIGLSSCAVPLDKPGYDQGGRGEWSTSSRVEVFILLVWRRDYWSSGSLGNQWKGYVQVLSKQRTKVWAGASEAGHQSGAHMYYYQKAAIYWGSAYQ
ncbi:hypothetical protein EDD17DRAFT_1509578 [Pisolithus thermaeus]|nr:hypothetical protein EDD17DRAFT_1509578 [Pisolithus thermaeus]